MARPPASFWEQADLVASRLVEWEGWVRVHAYGRADTHGADLVATLARLAFTELDPEICARCRAPFPTSVRTLDAMHLATAEWLRNRGFVVTIASYDGRMNDAAVALGFRLAALPAG